jgi:predicted RNA-binding Zn-ribbon protein involved in translation (DUF1610 family)
MSIDNKMNIRTKRIFLTFVILPLGFITFGLLGSIHWSFLILAYLHFLVVGKIASKIKCPKCGTPLGSHKHKWGNTTFYMYSALTKKQCDKCGYKF